jgi:hypothetical protein
VPVGSNEKAYYQATGYYKEPAGSSTFECKSPASDATWVGIGGWAGNKILGQTGTELHWEWEGKERPSHEGFYAILPNGTEEGKPVWLNFYGTPGVYVKAEAKWLEGPGTYQFMLYSYENGEMMAPKPEGEHIYYDGETADFINERQATHELFDFEKVTMQAFTNGKAFKEAGPIERVDMWGAEGENERVSNVFTNNYEFTMKFKKCKRSGSKEEKELEEAKNGDPAPKVATGGSTEVTSSTARLSGTVNPEGDNTVYQFDYGTEPGNFEASSQPASAGEGTETLPVGASVSELLPGTVYYYRLDASSGNGNRDGEERTFKTTGTAPPPPPSVTTEPATSIQAHAADLEASVDPHGAETHYYFEYGVVPGLFETTAPAEPGNDAGSGTSSVHEKVDATGLSSDTTYYYRVVASNSTGSTYGDEQSFTTPSAWKIMTTQNPEPYPALYDEFYGVACPGTDACTAVGSLLDAEDGAGTLVENWNGSTWQVEASPDQSDAYGSHLESVSCPSSTECMATGYYESTDGEHFTLAEHRIGSTWTVESTPTKGTSADLTSVSCGSASECVAAGYYFSGSTTSLVELWNGKKWTVETTAKLPKEDETPQFSAVSCPAAKSCLAVGSYYSTAHSGQPLAENWNGSKWTLTTPADPEGSTVLDVHLDGVSCSSTTACTAVGAYENYSADAEETLVERWNGTAWSLQTAKSPILGEPAHSSWELEHVSCPTAGSCVAVGDYKESASSPRQLLGEHWNGTAWNLEPPENRVGVKSNVLAGVACAGEAPCVAVGFSEKTGSGDETLAEQINEF